MAPEKKEAPVTPQPRKASKAEELHTDSPLSEKDEVKRAENKLRKAQKKHP